VTTVPPARVLAELEALAARLGVEVRREPFGKGVLEGRGGLCWVKGRPLVVMDEKLPVTERIGVLAGALGEFDLDTVHMMPAVRATIDAAREGRSMGAPRRTHPGLARTKPRR
jgi:hypothetical protein